MYICYSNNKPRIYSTATIHFATRISLTKLENFQ